MPRRQSVRILPIWVWSPVLCKALTRTGSRFGLLTQPTLWLDARYGNCPYHNHLSTEAEWTILCNWEEKKPTSLNVKGAKLSCCEKKTGKQWTVWNANLGCKWKRWDVYPFDVKIACLFQQCKLWLQRGPRKHSTLHWRRMPQRDYLHGIRVQCKLWNKTSFNCHSCDQCVSEWSFCGHDHASSPYWSPSLKIKGICTVYRWH